MSYNLYFWRETVAQYEAPDAVCARLCGDEEPEGIAWLSVAQIKARFADVFPEIEDSGTELAWEGARSYFQVSWPVGSKPGHTLAVFVQCGYTLLQSPQTMNRIIDVARDLGCALYDPHTAQRYPQPDPKRD
jgi:hypothetical protein